jgi:O-antigen ligase
MRIFLLALGVVANTTLLMLMDLSGWQMLGVFTFCLIVVLQTFLSSVPRLDEGIFCEGQEYGKR